LGVVQQGVLGWKQRFTIHEGDLRMAKDDPFKQFSDFQKNMAELKIPGIDPEQWMKVYEQNVAAVTHANQTFLTGMQAFTEKQAAMLQESLKSSEAAIQEAAEAGEPNAKVASQVERARAAYEKALADMNEISEIVTKTNAEAVEIINQRINDSFAEVQAILSENKG